MFKRAHDPSEQMIREIKSGCEMLCHENKTLESKLETLSSVTVLQKQQPPQPSQPQQSSHTLLIGDSLIRDVTDSKLVKTKVVPSQDLQFVQLSVTCTILMTP